MLPGCTEEKSSTENKVPINDNRPKSFLGEELRSVSSFCYKSVWNKRAACIGTMQNKRGLGTAQQAFWIWILKNPIQKSRVGTSSPCLPNRFSGQEPRCSIKKGFYWKTIRKRRLASNWFDFCQILVCCLYKVCYARTASVQCWIVLCSRTHAGNHSP